MSTLKQPSERRHGYSGTATATEAGTGCQSLQTVGGGCSAALSVGAGTDDSSLD